MEKDRNLGKDEFTLIDMSLKAHGKDEDEEYIKSQFYRENIRRGNTLIEHSGCFNFNSVGKMEWGRKGTPKTLDIQLEYI